ncbi:MAG: GGDEF-domain containing protein [Ilumatobacteraceae bacterium]|nr:GGDEF-domain containing protein [Ilumatobacteraceae bacterium]
MITDVGSFVAASVATVACIQAGRRAADDARAWILLGVASGLWAVGEALWTFVEVVLGDEVAFPSVADVAYLAAVPVALWGLVTFAPRRGLHGRTRTVLDGCLVGGSLLFVAWAAVLGPLWRDGASGSSAHVVELAYPVTDVAMAAVAILVLQVADPTSRRALRWLSVGLLVMAATDMAYAWVANAGAFASSNPIGLGWPVGYLCIVVAARSATRSRQGTSAASAVDSKLSIVLPYAPLVVVAAIAIPRFADGRDLGPFLAINGLAVIVIIIVRQGLTALELRSTVLALHERETELRELALHDPLTGLANRVHFAASFARSLTRGTGRAAVLYIDLDEFKHVNDHFGHAVGDALLVEVARRLQHCVTDGMLLARLGGDEFVVLVDEGEEAGEALAERILDAFGTVVRVDGDTFAISASIGLAAVPPGGTEDEAIRRADAAMYVAKGSGKARAVRYPDETFVIATREPGARPDGSDGWSQRSID